MTSRFTPDLYLDDLRNGVDAGSSSDERTIWLTPGSTFSDGEPVEILARISAGGDHAIISDGGAVVARASMFGADVEANSISRHLREVCADFGVEFYCGRYYLRVDVDAIAPEAAYLASACVALDSARLASTPARERFSNALDSWLHEQSHLSMSHAKSVQSVHGDTVHVTAIAESDRGEVLIQAAGGRTMTALRSSSVNAFFNYSLLHPDAHPVANRLIVLESAPKQGRGSNSPITPAAARLAKQLTQVATVAEYESKETILRFIKEGESTSRDLVSNIYDQQLGS